MTYSFYGVRQKNCPVLIHGFFRPEMLTRQQVDPDMVVATKPGRTRHMLYVGTSRFDRRGTWCQSESLASYIGRTLHSAATYLVY